MVSAGRMVIRTAHPDTGEQVEYGLRTNPDASLSYFGKVIETGAPLQEPVISKTIDGMIVNLTGYRRLRPGGKVTAKKRILAPHDPTKCSFCVGPISLAKNPANPDGRPPLAAIPVNGREWKLYHNISPIVAEGHFLIVPDIELSENRRPQELIPTDIEDILTLANHSEGLAFVFNGRGGGASQNHIHWQAFARSSPMAVERQPREVLARVNGVTVSRLPSYAATTLVLEGSPAAVASVIWPLIEHMQNPKHETPFNVYIAEGRVYLFPRNVDTDVTPEFPNFIFGTWELAGLFDLHTQEDFDAMSAERVHGAYRNTTLPQGVFQRLS